MTLKWRNIQSVNACNDWNATSWKKRRTFNWRHPSNLLGVLAMRYFWAKKSSNFRHFGPRNFLQNFRLQSSSKICDLSELTPGIAKIERICIGLGTQFLYYLLDWYGIRLPLEDRIGWKTSNFPHNVILVPWDRIIVSSTLRYIRLRWFFGFIVIWKKKTTRIQMNSPKK